GRHTVVRGVQQEGADAARGLDDWAKGPGVNRVLEGALSQSLGGYRVMPTMPGESVQGRPIALAEPSERLGAPRGAALGCFQHDTPARGLKPTAAGRIRAMILNHGPQMEKTRPLYNAPRAQKKAKRAGPF